MPGGTMRAAVLHGRDDLRIEPRPVPEPGPGEVLVEVSHCGVCGSDLHMVMDGWGRPGSIGGHEWSGRVAAVGPETARLSVGDAVVGGPTPGCGSCPACREGRTSRCAHRATPGTEDTSGAFADFVCADERSLVPVPHGLDLRTAALAEPLAVALHAVNRAAVAPGQRVLVAGAGPVGALVILALRARGVEDIVVSEPNPGRQKLATQLGSGSVVAVAPDELDVPSVVEPARIVDDPVDVALECSGRAAAMEAACGQLRVGGRLVLVGAGMEAPRFDPNRILLNELEVTGAFEYDPGGVAEAVDLLAAGGPEVGLAVDVLVEPDDIGLDGLLDAMRGLVAGSIAGKVLVDPRSGGFGSFDSLPEEP
jgi:threonine dehydrogenase-like Zn-dependent dehydrogenase